MVEGFKRQLSPISNCPEIGDNVTTNFTTIKVWTPFYTVGPGGIAIYVPEQINAYNSSGQSAVSDANLDSVNSVLYLNVAGGRGIPGLNLDPSQVNSLIGIEFPEILSRAINGALLTTLGPLYTTATPIGTIVQVTASDGTNAQFVRISLTGSVQWELKPGTLKNKSGQFIDANGNVIGASVNRLNNIDVTPALPNFNGSGMTNGDWTFWSPTPGVTITIGQICPQQQVAC